MYVLPQGELSSNWTVNTGSLHNCTVYSRGQGAHAQCVHCTLYSWRHVLVSAPVMWGGGSFEQRRKAKYLQQTFNTFSDGVMSAMRGMMHVIRDGIVGRGPDREEGGVTSWAKLLYYVKYHIYYFSMTMHAIIHNLQCSQHPYFKMAKFRKYNY